MMATQTWYAARTCGQFQEGRFYSREELGVMGRMAAHAGFLVPIEQVMPTPTGKVAAKPRKRRGVADGEASVQAGGSPDLRDDPGA